MENNLEAYLAQIEAQLKDVPAARRAEFIDEVRAHLGAMWEAKRADDLDAEAAWLLVATEFGEPVKVGRELRAQWANSGQLETEGAPLSPWRRMRLFAFPIAGCVAAYALIAMMRAPENQASWQMPVLAAFALGCLAFGTLSDVRKRGGWKASTIVGCAGAFVILSNALFNLSGHQEWGGAWREWGNFVFVLIWALLCDRLRKRERADRPWQWSSLYKSSPIAAEQAYRLSPIIGLAMGTTLSCIGILSLGSQFFGLPIALLACAGSIGAAVVYGRYLTK